jgi:hypothetical protein
LSEVGIPLLDQVRYHLPVIGVVDQPCKLNNNYMYKTSLLSKKYIWGGDISIIKVRLITKEIIKNLGFFFVVTY